MIIKEIRFSEFLVFDGEQVMQFPTKNEHNLTIILAPNNSGKTSIIRSLAFLFSGVVPGTAADKLHELIHANAKDSTKVGSQATGWVEVTIDQEDKDLCLRRTISARKVSETVWRTLESSLALVTRRDHKVFLQLDDKGIWQRKLHTLVPEDLFDAFYFRGEPMEGKLLGGVGNIRDSLASFLHENQWEEVETVLETLQDEYTDKLRALLAKNAESRQLLEDDERLQRFLREQEKQLAAAKAKLAQASEEFEHADNTLHEIGKKADTDELLKKLRLTRQTRDVARSVFWRACARSSAGSRGMTSCCCGTM